MWRSDTSLDENNSNTNSTDYLLEDFLMFFKKIFLYVK